MPLARTQSPILRKGKEKNIKIKLGELPEQEVSTPEEDSGEELGLELQKITPELAKAHNLSSDKGLIVTNIDPQGAAAGAGIQRGDIILEVNQKEVTTIEELRAKVKETDKGDMILFLIKRRESFQYLAVEKK